MGIVIQGIISFICALLYDKTDNEVCEIIGYGIFVTFLAYFCLIFNKCYNSIRFINTRSLIKTKNGEINYIKYKDVDNAICKINETHHSKYCNFVSYKDDLQDKYPVSLWNKNFVSCDIPNVRYCPKSVWKNFKPYKREEN